MSLVLLTRDDELWDAGCLMYGKECAAQNNVDNFLSFPL